MKSITVTLLLIVGTSFCGFTSNSESPSQSSSASDSAKCIDVDGNEYSTIQIGDQIWMAENLNVSRFRNGDELFHCEDEGKVLRTVYEDLSAYAHDKFQSGSSFTYGKCYSGHSIGDSRKIAPEGWHIPTQKEWNQMVKTLGGPYEAIEKIKSKHSWNRDPGTNSSGFDALATGHLFASLDSKDDTQGSVLWRGEGSSSFWWTATPTKDQTYYIATMNAFNEDFTYGQSNTDGFCYIRCVKD